MSDLKDDAGRVNRSGTGPAVDSPVALGANHVAANDSGLSMSRMVVAIDEIGRLREGWLNGSGHPVSSINRGNAMRFLASDGGFPVFHALAPTGEGGILFEYEHGGWDWGVEFNRDSTIHLFGIESGGTDEFSRCFEADGFDAFLSRFRETFAGKSGTAHSAEPASDVGAGGPVAIDRGSER